MKPEVHARVGMWHPSESSLWSISNPSQAADATTSATAMQLDTVNQLSYFVSR
jgi:hypothetical protein